MKKVTYTDINNLKTIEEEEKGDSYLFSYDTLKAVFENKESDDDERRINQYCISIYHSELWEDLVTIDCKNLDLDYWVDNIDKDYDIELENMTFLEFVDCVKAVEEEMLKDIGNLRDDLSEKVQELADTYDKIKKIMERD